MPGYWQLTAQFILLLLHILAANCGHCRSHKFWRLQYAIHVVKCKR